ncbi:MAG: glutamate:gamma-aminobutyrate antiporter [Desulfovibrionaceae bacterium]
MKNTITSGANIGKVGQRLSLFAFFSITASMVMTVYEYPTFATSGFNLVFFLLLGGLLWFVPVALCAAEMATLNGWGEGGIFSWVGNTLGPRYGFAAIFFQWFQITVGFIVMIYFILGALSYVFGYSALDTNPMIRFIGVMVVFWTLTFSQLGGTKNTARIAKIGFLFGIVLPVIILFALSMAYLFGGNPILVDVSMKSFIPNFSKPSTLVVFVSFILAYMGVEASATHVNEMENPKRDYPLAIFILVLVAIILNTIGGMTIASVIPLSELSLSSGVVQTFESLILRYGEEYKWCVKVIAIMISCGVIAEISSWVVGPSKGMYAAAKSGLLPAKFAEVNKNDVPVFLIIVQGIIVSIWAAILTFAGGGGGNLSFMTAISMTVVIYLIAYLLFFIGYFVLIFKKDTLVRTYSIPGGKIVKTIVAMCGLGTSLFALIISFFPPANLQSENTGTYMFLLTVSSIVTLVLPFILYSMKGKWRKSI